MLLSELMSLALFLASVGVYAWKAGRNTWWFIATLVVLGIFIILNITLYASDYFTGDGINDAVLYTLTNSLTGAGVGKYILPGLGLVVALVTSPSSAPSWLQPAGISPGAGLRRRQPGVPSDHRAGEIPVARRRPGFCGLLQRTVENDRQPETQSGLYLR
jgi:hypothetical protein